ncbi:hypothetical protein ASPNIDRAFT_129918, partial [Aspergillus niger ATCC 1015]
LLLTINHSKAVDFTVIVIDALDKCEPEKNVEIILNLLSKIKKIINITIQFFLTSRPEISICFGFDQINKSKYHDTILQNLDKDRFWYALPPGWPGEKIIKALIIIACPLFIFAATVCRFVADSGFDPDERLQEFSTSSTGSKLDGTYRPVLNQLLVRDATDRNKLIEKFQKIIGCYLKKNICELPSYGTSRTEIYPEFIVRSLPPVLQYACPTPARILDQMLMFLKKHLLYWFEAMGILGMISEAIIAIFAPHKALIRGNFKKELPAWLSKDPKVEEYWDPEMQTIESHSNSVSSVAFSNNGQLLASGSLAHTIKLWDAATGALKHTLEDYSNSVSSVAFSSNGQLLASGSLAHTIKLWDAATGALKHTLEGHSNS